MNQAAARYQIPNDERSKGRWPSRVCAAQKLAARAPQRRLQALLLVVPAVLFGLRPLLKSLNFGLDGGGPVRVLPLGFVQRSRALLTAC